jgi:hypothetical protein
VALLLEEPGTDAGRGILVGGGGLGPCGGLVGEPRDLDIAAEMMEVIYDCVSRALARLGFGVPAALCRDTSAEYILEKYSSAGLPLRLELEELAFDVVVADAEDEAVGVKLGAGSGKPVPVVVTLETEALLELEDFGWG